LFEDEHILALGMLSLALGSLIGRFTSFEYSGFSVSDFIEGMLIGLSIALFFVYMIMKKKK